MRGLIITESEKRRILNMHNKKRSQVFEGIILGGDRDPINYLTNLYFDEANTKWDQLWKITNITNSGNNTEEKWGQILNISLTKNYTGAKNCDNYPKECQSPGKGADAILKFDCTTGTFDFNGTPRFQKGIKNVLENSWCPKETAPGKVAGDKYASTGMGSNDGSSSMA